ncbi:conserved hypothetical protein [Histoplasma mississippiense (nom. inval.)]|uniref:conserved hypothetical protein n=1 Tax=Ajellomyces capsulatus (strain NAm1 / WU24) TaxID=2059318 RepID=UPI000157BFCA|nr:conserved hypothetical protein [Histoplasma mississippiense (nom. inval.)]EDN06521.1 conserved hypothetical protein [Histoplasma mississippiense (nom. inval.)]
MDFDINESLKYYLSDPSSAPTPEADPELLDRENDPESLTSPVINGVLNPIVDAVAENPEGLGRSSFFDSLQFLLKLSSQLPTKALSKILDLVISGLAVEADIIHHDMESDESDTVQHHKQLLEMYAFLLQWTLSAVETKLAEKPAIAAHVRRGAGKSKPRPAPNDERWDSSIQIQTAMEVMCKVLKLKLGKIFMTTSDRDTFVNLFTRTIYLILERAQTSIVQSLTYFEHLSEPMAEFLHILAEQYDYPQLSDEILREIGNKEFNSNDSKGPKSVSAFIIRLSELAPRLIIKQMTLLAKQLDSEAYTLRCAVIEVCGNLISDLSKQEERNENHTTQINSFFEVLEERFLDVNPYCRCRAIQVYMKLAELDQKFPKRRQTAAELATRSLEDKSSNVRRNAIKLLGKLVSTHPFSVMHGGQLSYKEWDARLQAVDAELNSLRPPPETPGLGEDVDATNIDSELLDDVTQMPDDSPSKAPRMTEEQKQQAMRKAAEEAATSELLTRLQLTRKYYLEAIRFIEVLHHASHIVSQLLSSRNKNEVIEAMDFFVIIDAYKVETARAGIRRMLRLIWTKGNSDEGKGVQSHLIDCYKGLFFEAPDSFSSNDAANYIARNMISLTFGATPAELTSLEQLLSTMMKIGHISDVVIAKLWQVYSVQKKEISKTQRRGAIIVLAAIIEIDSDSKEWYGVAEHAIGAIYSLAKHPDALCSEILRRKTSTNQAFPKKHEASEDDELDLIGGTTEDDFTEAMAHIRERELLFGPTSLLTNFGPLVAEICANNNTYPDRNLQAAATLCMAKLMCVSGEYCEKNLPLLITIMERSEDPIVRSNAVIALGDMAVCFNHLIDENTDFLYRRLNDSDVSVKRTCLMTLTFLILAGQVKVKGQLGEMAKCLEDDDKRIADLARILLSTEKSLEEDALRRIIKFLAGFVEKDKHAKQLAEKLAARLARCNNERQWNDITYALSLLAHKNEEIIKTVTAGFRVVKTNA